MAQWKFVEWLYIWILETSNFEFEWDNGNRTKNATKHFVLTTEAEEVFKSGLAMPLGLQIHPPVNEQRLGIIGPTFSGRMLQLVFVLRKGLIRVISARPAHRKERKQYEEILHKISEKI